MKTILALTAILLFSVGCFGMLTNPRVMKCDKCGDMFGMIGGHLPFQCTRCSCGGTNHVVRRMTYEEWQQSERRGYVTENPPWMDEEIENAKRRAEQAEEGEALPIVEIKSRMATAEDIIISE